ncbi:MULTISPECIES: YraN family protein [unclassified Caldicellulosiruptor]|uniref:YraN family protein n=1 Tax=unclassified Caldicellulosiruptor TaxID=2622462 RepID=UPI0003A2465E|nr:MULTISPECIES: YraN family protein [unclassified Caldicellulosiruptor]
MNKRELGNSGEEKAVEFLKKMGYEILHRNFRCKLGEVDIIAKEGNTIVFVEVKTRRSLKFGYPSEAITMTKQRHLKRVAEYFVQRQKAKNCMYRFDVVEVYMNAKNEVLDINLIKNAF